MPQIGLSSQNEFLHSAVRARRTVRTSPPMSELTIPQARLRWYQGIDRYCWVVLVVAALGWMFDTMDQNLFNLVRAQSVKELLGPDATDPAVRKVGGWVTSAFLVGWSV